MGYLGDIIMMALMLLRRLTKKKIAALDQEDRDEALSVLTSLQSVCEQIISDIESLPAPAKKAPVKAIKGVSASGMKQVPPPEREPKSSGAFMFGILFGKLDSIEELLARLDDSQDASFGTLRRNDKQQSAILAEIRSKLDGGAIGSDEKARLDAYDSSAYPSMIAASDKLNVFTPEESE